MATIFEVQRAYTIAALRQLLHEEQNYHGEDHSVARLFYESRAIDSSLDLLLVLSRTAFARSLTPRADLIGECTARATMLEGDVFDGYQSSEYEEMWLALHDAIESHVLSLNYNLCWNDSDEYTITFYLDTKSWWVTHLLESGGEVRVFELSVPA